MAGDIRLVTMNIANSIMGMGKVRVCEVVICKVSCEVCGYWSVTSRGHFTHFRCLLLDA